MINSFLGSIVNISHELLKYSRNTLSIIIKVTCIIGHPTSKVMSTILKRSLKSEVNSIHVYNKYLLCGGCSSRLTVYQ